MSLIGDMNRGVRVGDSGLMSGRVSTHKAMLHYHSHLSVRW